MNSFLVSFNAIMPLATYILIGVAVTYFKLMDEDFLEKFNSFMFKYCYPILIFSNVYNTDFAVAADVRVIVYNLVFIATVASVLVVVAPLVIDSRPTCSSFVQAGFRSNVLLFGLPLTISIFGADSTGMIGITAAFIVPLYNVIAVIVLEYFRGENITPLLLIKSIVKNPLIRGATFGIGYNLLGGPRPQVMQQIMSNLATSTTVFAIIILGASLKFSSLKSNMKYLVGGITLRLIVAPAIAVSIAYNVLGFVGMPLFVTLVISAAPVAASAFTMARNMDGDYEICAQYIAISTVLSVFTIFCWMSLMMSLGLI